MNGKIKCCIKCLPPVRHIGCHGTCSRYINEKMQVEERKEKIKKAKQNERIHREYAHNRMTQYKHSSKVSGKH